MNGGCIYMFLKINGIVEYDYSIGYLLFWCIKDIFKIILKDNEFIS